MCATTYCRKQIVTLFYVILLNLVLGVTDIYVYVSSFMNWWMGFGALFGMFTVLSCTCQLVLRLDKSNGYFTEFFIVSINAQYDVYNIKMLKFLH
jgi:hypothetical protein